MINWLTSSISAPLGGKSMETGQLRRLIEGIVDLSATVCAEGRVFDLKEFAAIFPLSGKLTTAQFANHLKKSLPKGGKFPCPKAVRAQLDALESLLSLAGAKPAGDIKSLLALLDANRTTTSGDFLRQIVAARDFVPPAKVIKPKATPKTDAAVAGYVDRLKKTAVRSREFEVVFNSLKADTKLSDARIKKISKALWGKSAKSRDQALQHILEFQNREVLSYSSEKGLELAPV
jgi:hypothetical protein